MTATGTDDDFLRATLNASPTPMMMVSPELRILFVNHVFSQTVGAAVAPGRDVVGSTLADLADSIRRVFADGAGILERLGQRGSDQTSWYQTEARQVWPDEHDYIVHSSPVLTRPSENAGYAGRLLVFRDVSEERAAERSSRALATELRHHKNSMELELLRAAEVQRMLLPSVWPSIPGFSLAFLYLPAFTIGGDFYDWWQPRPGLVNLILGDVSGKGAPASMLMATVRAVLRATAGDARPAVALRRAAPFLNETLQEMGAFTTLFFAQLDVARRRLRYVDAGHGLAILRQGGVTRPAVGPRSLPIGVDADDTYVEAFVDLEPGDAIAAFTDGLLETGVGRECRPIEALAELVEPGADAQAISHALLSSHAGLAAADDVAVLVLEATPAAASQAA